MEADWLTLRWYWVQRNGFKITSKYIQAQVLFYGTVLQLCATRNHRRLSSSCYNSVAQVTSRRARKGFTLKFNPDAHWSNLLYRSLNIFCVTDGSNIMFLNCDDAAGFRFDALTTHHQCSTPVVNQPPQPTEVMWIATPMSSNVYWHIHRAL